MAQRIILDTDIGSDIDDAYALALVLASPELELVGVTVAHGPTDQRARLALKMLYLAGREDIPVAVGRPTRGGGSVNQAPWAEGFSLVQPVGQTAAEFIVEQVNAAPAEITLVPIGPLTNVADALAIDPLLPGKLAGIVMMGGCVGWPEGATPEIKPEYNVVTDLPAAQAVVGCGARLTMVPLDATYKVKLGADRRQRLAEHDTPLTRALVELLPLWPGATPILHDPLAVGMVIDPTICGVTELRLEVDQAGCTQPVEGPPNARVAVSPQVGRFLAEFMERLLSQELRRSQ